MRVSALLTGLSLFTTVFASSKRFQQTDTIKEPTQVSPTVWNYDTKKVRGISLGGWLVLEPYITPSLFEQFGTDEKKIPIDEYTFTKRLGKTQASTQLEKHWSSFYSEADFRDIKTHGLNLVRIPIGYWAFKLLDDDPYVQGQEKYLDLAIQWAKKHDLKVWIDLHGVPGSQNGFDNSGKRGPVDWQKTKRNIEVSTETLDYIFKKYGADNYLDTVIGIEIINEPMMPAMNLDEAMRFHYDRYYDFRIKHMSKNYFLIQEGFLPVGYWNQQFNSDFMNVTSHYTNVSTALKKNKYFNGIVIDHHRYEVFTDGQLLKSNEARIADIRGYSVALSDEQRFHPSLVGEWSGAITDCAKWLNGVGTGARYDGTYSVGQLNTSSLVWGADGEQKTLSNLCGSPAPPTDEPPTKEQNDIEDDLDDFDEEYEDYDDTEDEDSYDDDYEENMKLHKHMRVVRRENRVNSMAEKTCSNVRKYEDMSPAHRESIRKFIEAQLVYYEKYTAGWIFWCYKTEGAIEWDFKLLVKHGLFPIPFDTLKHFRKDGTEIPLKSASNSLPAPLSSSALFGASLLLFASVVLF